MGKIIGKTTARGSGRGIKGVIKIKGKAEYDRLAQSSCKKAKRRLDGLRT